MTSIKASIRRNVEPTTLNKTVRSFTKGYVSGIQVIVGVNVLLAVALPATIPARIALTIVGATLVKAGASNFKDGISNTTRTTTRTSI
jgi:hypothetical protein